MANAHVPSNPSDLVDDVPNGDGDEPAVRDTGAWPHRKGDWVDGLGRGGGCARRGVSGYGVVDSVCDVPAGCEE